MSLSARLRSLAKALLCLTAILLALWAFGALWFDAAPAAAWAFLAALVLAAWILHRTGRAWFVPFAGFASVLTWWLALTPSNDRRWSLEYSRLPHATTDGDTVTLTNVRNFDYPATGEEVPRWETRTFNLSDVTALDLAVNYWGSPWIAHPIVIFRFNNAPPLAFSIETRREEGEDYSAIAGFFRQYELIVLAGHERDLLGVRTNHRQGEDVYLYSTTTSPERARDRLLEYLETINSIHRQARWYNAVTSNCTTAIRGMNHGPKMPFDWRLLINGKADEMLHERGLLRTGGFSFQDLKRRAHINPVASQAYGTLDFSRAIRTDRPGFSAPEN